MEKAKNLSADLNAMTEQTAQQAHEAMGNYLNFFQKNMSFAPWANTELTKKVTDYAQENFNSASGFAHKLAQAKDLEDLVRI